MTEPILNEIDQFFFQFESNFSADTYNNNIVELVKQENIVSSKIHDSLLNFAVQFRNRFNLDVVNQNLKVLRPKVEVHFNDFFLTNN